jgi:glycosyltransferase involved in cell wall biosynthesis
LFLMKLPGARRPPSGRVGATATAFGARRVEEPALEQWGGGPLGSEQAFGLPVMKIYYAASSYASHLRAAKAYRALLSRAYPLVNDIASADVVVLHHEPRDFGALYADYPELRRKYVIGYCVWEANELPDAYKQSIAHVQEIWTCSAYSKAAFDQHHPNVWCIPHVVARDTKFSPADLAHVRALLRHDPRHVYFLAIALQASRRKNVGALVRAFRELHAQIPEARLVLRTGPGERATFDAEPAIIRLPDTLRWSEINALYSASSAYVSAHHAEGWGLTLSDAMLFRKPVIATGYSGNLEYMSPESSFLVGYAEEHVRPEDCEDLFHSGMKWAYPDEDELKRQILFVKENEREPAVLDRVRLASEQLSRFAPASVAALLYARLGAIAGSPPRRWGAVDPG